jgi:hypothetical protein
MDRYIGLDAHASSCTVATVGPSGRGLHSHVVETNAGVLRGIPGTRHLCLEEGTHASWLYEVLSPHVEEIVVAAVRESRGPKSDKLDAFGLAEQLRIGAITATDTTGFFSPNAPLRLLVTGWAQEENALVAQVSGLDGLPPATSSALPPKPTRAEPRTPDTAPARPSRWAALLARIYEAFPLVHPACRSWSLPSVSSTFPQQPQDGSRPSNHLSLLDSARSNLGEESSATGLL